jgi:hypothetical protein
MNDAHFAGALIGLGAYAASDHASRVLNTLKLIDEMHGPRKLDVDDWDARCKTCRTSQGKPEPWPCDTFWRIHDVLIPQGPLNADAVRWWRISGAARNGVKSAVSQLSEAFERIGELTLYPPVGNPLDDDEADYDEDGPGLVLVKR